MWKTHIVVLLSCMTLGGLVFFLIKKPRLGSEIAVFVEIHINLQNVPGIGPERLYIYIYICICIYIYIYMNINIYICISQ